MKNEKKERNIGKYKKVALLVTYDILAVVLAEFLSIWARFEFTLTLPDSARDYLATAWNYLPINILITILIFAFMKLYSSLWQYASVQELMNVCIACLLAAGSQSVGMHMLFWSMPRSYYILYFFFC